MVGRWSPRGHRPRPPSKGTLMVPNPSLWRERRELPQPLTATAVAATGAKEVKVGRLTPGWVTTFTNVFMGGGGKVGGRFS